MMISMEQGTEKSARVGSKIPTFPPSARPTNGIPKFGFRPQGIPKPQAANVVTILPPIPTTSSVAFLEPESRNLKPVAASEAQCPPDEPSDEGLSPEEGLSVSDEVRWRKWVGKRVAISGVKQGILLYFGTTHFATGFFCGVQLDEPEGRHDGCLNGVRYYNCPANHGVFAPVSKVAMLGNQDGAQLTSSTLSETATSLKSRLPPPKSVTMPSSKSWIQKKADCESLSTTFVSELTSPEQSNSTFYTTRRSSSSSLLNTTVLLSDKSLNRSYTIDDPNRTYNHDSFLSDSNTLVEKSQHNKTFNFLVEKDHNSTFYVETPSSTQDEVEESSLGLLTPSQMLDFSFGNDMSTGALCKEIGHLSIPKTHSCDDINDLPEEEVVEDITVEYIQSELGMRNHVVTTKHQSFDSRFKSPTGLPGIKEHKAQSSTPLNCSKGRPIGIAGLASPVLTDKPVGLSLESSPMSNMSDFNDSFTSMGLDNISILDDQQLTLCNITYDNTFQEASSMESPEETSEASAISKQLHLTSEKAEQLVSILKGLPIGEALLKTLKEVDVSILEGISSGLVKERADVLESAAAHAELCTLAEQSTLENKDKEDHRGSTSTPMTKSVEWASEVVEVSKKHRLVSSTGSLANCDLNAFRNVDETMSIEKVMEQIRNERGELYKNRPTSTYTVGSTDTGYQGDAEYDQQSEIGTNAGSPCEEIKHLSMSSQDSAMPEDSDNDKMVKSGHMSDSDFFTDQGMSENEGDQKQSLSSSVEGGKPLSGIAEDEDDTVEAISVLEKEASEKMSDDGGTTGDERARDSSLDITIIEIVPTKESPSPVTAIETDNLCAVESKEVIDHKTNEEESQDILGISPKSGISDPSGNDDSKKSKEGDSAGSNVALIKAARVKTPKRPQVVVSKAAPVKVVGVSRIKALIEAPQALSEEAAAKRAARTPKKSRWDSVTAKISDDKDKPKVKKEVRSRINTNLAGARQSSIVLKKGEQHPNENEGSVASGHRTPSSKSQTITAITDSILPLDPTSRDSIDDLGDVHLEPNSHSSTNNSQKASLSCASSEICSIRAPSPAAPSEHSIASSRFSRKTNSKIAVRAMAPVSKSASATNPSTDKRSIQSRYQQVPPMVTAANNAASKSRTKDVVQNRTSKSTIAPTVSTVARLRPTQALAKVDELSKEVQRLGALCEARTKELNMVKMQTKHTALGFDAFGVLVKYLVGELDAFSHPDLVADIQKTKEQLITLESVLNQCEAENESMKKIHSEQLNTLAVQLSNSEEQFIEVSNALKDAKLIHTEVIRKTKEEHDKEIIEVRERHVHYVENKKLSYQKQINELQTFQNQRLEELVQTHEFEKSEWNSKYDTLQQKYQALEIQTKSFEEALNKDTDYKIQWISAKNSELQKEVDSLKSVMDMKQAEVHDLRNENMKMKKGLDELPMERHRVKKLQARNEELQALVREKVRSEKKLSYDHRNLKEQIEQEEKLKQQLSMENEELHWKLKHSFDCSSLANISIDGNVISWMATPELADRFRSMRMMSSAPLTPFHESAEDQMSRSLPNFSDGANVEEVASSACTVRKLTYSKPKPKRPSKSCSASPRKSPSRHYSSHSRSTVSSTPMNSQSCRPPLDLSTITRSHIEETLDISGTSSRSLESAQSLTELHFKACLQIDAMEEMAQMTGTGIDVASTRALLRSPDALSSDSGGAGGFSSLASSSVAEDGMSASVSSVEPDEKEHGGLTPDPGFEGVFSPRSEAGEAMTNNDLSPVSRSSGCHHSQEHPDIVTFQTSKTNGEPTSNSTSCYDPCYCDDFDINSEPE